MALAALIPSLSVSGSRTADGSVNAEGRVYVYAAGTTTTVQVYADANGATGLSQPITLDAAGKKDIYVTQPVDVYVETSAGAAIQTIANAVQTTAPLVRISNSATAATTLDGYISTSVSSFGSTDFEYLGQSGATARPLRNQLGEAWLSVKEFGATGDGATDDTTAIQAALTRATNLGGGTVYLPKGTYLVSAALVLDTATGVTVAGAGRGATTIKSNNTGPNLFSITLCTYLTMRDFSADHTSSSGDAFLALFGCQNVTLRGLALDHATYGWAYGADIQDSGTTPATDTTIDDCFFRALGTHSCGVRISSTVTTSTRFRIINSTLIGASAGAAGAGVAIGGAAHNVAVTNCYLVGTYGALVGGGATTATVAAATTSCIGISVVGCVASGSTADIACLPTHAAGFCEVGNRLLTSATVVNNSQFGKLLSPNGWPVGQRLEGATNTKTISGTDFFIPDVSLGNVWKLTLDNTASDATLNDPPANGPPVEGSEFWLIVKNTATITSCSIPLTGLYKNLTGVSLASGLVKTTGKITVIRIVYTNGKYYLVTLNTGDA